MLRDSKYPILEFDDDRESLIKPTKPKTKYNVSPNCVLCLLQEVIDLYKKEYNLQQISTINSVVGQNPIYQFKYKKNRYYYRTTWSWCCIFSRCNGRINSVRL